MEEILERTARTGKIPFRQLPKTEQNFRIVNLVISVGLAAWMLVLLILCLNGKFARDRLLTCATMTLACLAPWIVELIFRIRLSCFVHVFYYVYLAAAGIVGSVYGMYGRTNWYDVLMHGLFGYVGSVAGLFLIGKFGDYGKVKAATVAVFCFAVSMALGAVWEMMEFAGDMFLGQSAQGGKVVVAGGEAFTPVNDTMEDILMNFLGAAIFLAHFIAHRVSRKNLLLGSVIKDFTTK